MTIRANSITPQASLDVVANSSVIATFNRANFTAVMVSGDNLSDTITINDPYLTMPLVVDGGDATDFVRMESRGSGLTSLYGSNGDDYFDFSFVAHNLANVVGFTNVFGGSGTDGIFLHDDAYASPGTYHISSSLFFRAGLNGVQYAGDLEGLTLTTGTAADTVDVEGAAPGTPVYVNTAAGADTVNVGDGNGLEDIHADVQIQNTPAFTTLNINDAGDAFADSAYVFNTANGFGALQGMAGGGSIYWKISDITSVAITSGNLNDTITLQSTYLPITFNSAGGHDTLFIGNNTNGMQSVTANITVLNNPSTTDITLNDAADPSAEAIGVSNTTIGGLSYGQVTGLAASGAVIYFKNNDASSVTIETSSHGGNSVSITANSKPITVAGASPFNGPNDGINVGTGGSMAGIQATVNLSNSSGYDNVNLNDNLNNAAPTFALSTFLLAGNDLWGKVARSTAFAGEVNYHVADTAILAVNTGPGATANVSATPVSTNLNQIATGHFVVNVAATSAPLSISQYSPGNAGLAVFLGSNPSYGNGVGNVQGINGAVTITSSDASVVTVDDSSDTSPHNATLSSTQLAGLSPATITYPSNCGLVVYGSSVNTAISESSAPTFAEFDGGPATDTVNIESVTGTFNVNGGGGVDFINVTPQGGNLDAIPGTLTLNASASSYLNINDQNNPNNTVPGQDIFTNTGVTRVDYHYVLVGSPPIPTLLPFGVSVGYSGFGNVTFAGGHEVTVYSVPATAAGTSLTINEGAAGDGTNIGDTGSHSLLGIVSPVTINGAGGAMSLDDSGVSSPVTVHVNPNQIGASAGDNLFGVGGTLTYSGIGSLTLTTPNASTGDKVYVRPSPSTSMAINGGNPTIAPGDALTVADADATNRQFTPNGTGAGQYTFGNRQPVTFTGFESSVQDAVAPSILSGSFQFGALPLSLVFTASENLMGTPGSLAPFNINRVSPFAFIAPTSVNYLNNTITANFSGILSDGNYHATVVTTGITDVAGNPLSANFNFDFFVLAADANRDRKVDQADLGILSLNWGQTGRTFSQGNFDYSPDGKVDVNDLNILASHWKQTLAAPVSSPEVPIKPVRSPQRIAVLVL
jgi:hypothetical protein